MLRHDELSRSLWQADTLVEFPALDGDWRADVCVVGAGIAGLSVAYTLAYAGKEVIVLDHASVGGGETTQTTAHRQVPAGRGAILPRGLERFAVYRDPLGTVTACNADGEVLCGPAASSLTRVDLDEIGEGDQAAAP